MPRVHAAPASATGVSASCAAVIARSATVQVSSASDAQTTSCWTRAYTSASAAFAMRRCAPPAARAAILASVTRRGSTRPTSVRCWVDWCHSRHASATLAVRAFTSAGPGATTMSGSRTASRIAGTASCGMRAKEASGTEVASPMSMSVPARTATSPTASASASLTSSGRRGGSLVPRSMPLSQDADMPTRPASTGRVRPLRSRRIWMRSPVRFPARSSSISQPQGACRHLLASIGTVQADTRSVLSPAIRSRTPPA